MIKRNVKFTVKANGSVLPSIPLYGGVKGEHHATLVGLFFENGQAEDGSTICLYEQGDELRLSFTTGDGTILSSDRIEEVTVTEEGAYTEYAIGQLLTLAGGQLCMRAVIADAQGRVQRRSAEMVLYFEEASVENGTPFWMGVSEMLARTVSAKDAAVQAQWAAADHVKAADAARVQSESAQQAAQGYAASALTAQDAAVSAQAQAEIAEASAWEAVNTPGRQGERGKSAYETAVEGGYEGTEAAFAATLAHKMMQCAGTVSGLEAMYNLTDVTVPYTVVYVSDIRQFYMYMGGQTWFALDKGDPYTLTDADKAAIVADVSAVSVAKNQGAANVGKILVVGTDGNLVLVDMPEGGASGDVIGTLDDSNNILLTGNLADGTYTLKYENTDGSYSDIGTLVVSAVEPDTPTITNLAVPDETATGETAWASGGWCNDSYMAGSSYAYRAAADGKVTTNTIAVEYGDTIYVKGIKYNAGTFPQIAIFDADGAYIKHGYVSDMLEQSYISNLTATDGEDDWCFDNIGMEGNDVGARFIRLAGLPSGSIDDIIITRNQPIV